MSESTPQTTLNDMARGFFRGKLLCAAVRLGIADALADSEKTADELAGHTASNPEGLLRLLRALASVGVVAETETGRFALTPLGQPLRRDHPQTVWASMIFWPDLLADSWTYLADCVRAGDKSGAAAAMERAGTKSRWAAEPNAVAIFHAVFAESNAESMAPFDEAFDFSSCRVVADLGGAAGGLLAAIFVAYPHVRGMLVERSEAIAAAKARMQSMQLADRCDFIAGDLLANIPAGADVAILKCVLHGYGDESARQILANCRAVLPEHGRLLVIEVVLPSHVAGPDPRVEAMLMGDINMFAVTGGRERSEPEWSTLLASAGFAIRNITPVAGATSSVIEAIGH